MLKSKSWVVPPDTSYMPALYIHADMKCSKTLLICHIYSDEWPLQMPSRLNPLGTGGKYHNKNVPGERPRGNHQN